MRSTSIRADAQLQSDVVAAIALEIGSGSSDVAVAAQNGVVTLAGETDSLPRRLAVVRAATRVHGVREVADTIYVVLPVEQRRTDADLAEAVVSALISDGAVPEKTIKARIQDQWVWLVGEAEFEHQRLAAENAVQGIAGVKGVTNLVRIRKRAIAPE